MKVPAPRPVGIPFVTSQHDGERQFGRTMPIPLLVSPRPNRETRFTHGLRETSGKYLRSIPVLISREEGWGTIFLAERSILHQHRQGGPMRHLTRFTRGVIPETDHLFTLTPSIPTYSRTGITTTTVRVG